MDGCPPFWAGWTTPWKRIRELLEGRAAQGRLVDGHGDLKPEHICLEERVVIFDCLEFSAELRLVDPVDELAYLSVECALLGGAMAWLSAVRAA